MSATWSAINDDEVSRVSVEALMRRPLPVTNTHVFVGPATMRRMKELGMDTRGYRLLPEVPARTGPTMFKRLFGR